MTSTTGPRLRLFGGAVMISFSPVFVALVTVSPTTSGFYRALFGGIALSAFILLSGRRLELTRAAWLAVVGAACFFALDLWFWHRSIVLIGPGLSTLLANLQVFFMMAAGILFLGQRPTRLQIVAAPLAITGLILIVGVDWSALTPAYRAGVVFGLLTAVSYAGYMLAMRRARMNVRYAVPLREVAVMSMIVATLLGIAAALEGESLRIPSYADAGWLLAYGILAHATGLMLIASSLAKVSTTETGIALLLQPALSFVWDVLLFARPVTLAEGAGACITLLAIFLGAVRSR